MSSDGEFSEGEEYSQQSQGPEYAAEVREEEESLQEHSTNDDSNDSDYDPDSPPNTPSSEGDDEEDNDNTDDAELAHDWGTEMDQFDPMLQSIIEAQKLPDTIAVKERLGCLHGLIKQSMEKRPEVRKHVLRLLSLSADFWEHIEEEFSDHVLESLRTMKRLDSRIKKSK
jgi:flagellar motility protein MotE (MotC chaperone)